jgi:hypothetical protein
MIRSYSPAQTFTLIPVGLEFTVTDDRGSVSHKGETGYLSCSEMNRACSTIVPVLNFVRFAVINEWSQIDINR